MKITQADFIISAVGPAQYPEDGLPEIALAGRSNVGKSSLINRLIQRRNLARTSSQPGKTQHLNYYRINDAYYFVDVPGYGFAKVSKTQRQEWGRMIEAYFQDREPLKLALQVVDLRHPPSKDDILMYDWLSHYNIPLCVVATKADKLPRSKWASHLKEIRKSLLMRPDHKLIMFSSETGAGRDELWEVIVEAAGTGEQVEQETAE
ncbi:ribosome biogenesis GTP-binding protein YihA/YsxC [Paenibacillus marinisediminis]